ncbi:hypothetical protein FF38_05106 [Lucilia cuprina]|uniref:Uncharacterized protein n=1 Tax=Lucilia cuprina TaxID=7375 RepID=A0A0L0C5R3_LUCCU|nr:hypothetical protein CVS40_8492 [Lucilia cuprina]KNC27581.1 hypothetical protein FF38_05106 [Lucilia cuprina]
MVFGHLFIMNHGLTIRALSAEEEDETTSSSKTVTESSYRKSVAKIQETSYRVPEHLQFVPKGFIYEDADDVIHVIDPPKHFEELKKIMQRQEQRQLHNLRPIALREQRPKPKILKTTLPLKSDMKINLKKPSVQMDLETQESEHLPLEILASVRKTENYLRKYKPKLPAVKQRLQTQKIQTVIWEKSQEQQQYQQGQDHRLQGIREQQQQYQQGQDHRLQGVRDQQQNQKGPEYRLKGIKDQQGQDHRLQGVRDQQQNQKGPEHRLKGIRDQQEYQQGQDHRLQGIREQQKYQQGPEHRIQASREQLPNRRYFNKKRSKREAPAALKGDKLINYINDLIKNASLYLEQTQDYPDTDLESPTTPAYEHLLKTTQFPKTNTDIDEDMVVKILENSIRATNVIMQQIKRQTNISEISEKCDYVKVTYPNHIKNLENQINCMQNFIKDLNRSRQEKAQRVTRKYGERLEARKTKDLKHKPFLVAQLAADYIDSAEPSPVNSSLIYDDVMTTIRNMLETQNLQSIDDSNTATSDTTWQDSLAESSFTYDKSPEPVDFHNLQQYLTSLQSIVTNLPKFSHKLLNLRELDTGSTSKYYFINPQGSIYNLPQPFQKDITTPSPPSTIFHRFPDLPIVTEYLKNGTLLSPSQHVVEILK